MEKFIKFPCPNRIIRLACLIFLAVLYAGTVSPINAAESMKIKGGYFLFSDDLKYLYGSADILIKSKSVALSGDVIYLDVERLEGVVYGNVKLTLLSNKTADGKDAVGSGTWDAVYFNGLPARWLKISYSDVLHMDGDLTLKKGFSEFIKKTPEMLKNASLYYEFREFSINTDKKIKAKIVIPYMMGMPTMPLKKFTVNRGKWEDKTMVSFNNVNYSGLDGLSLSFFARLREKLLHGDYDLKLYERKLFNLDEPKRGFLFSGNNSFFPGKKNTKNNRLLSFTTLLNSGEKSFNLVFAHQLEGKYFRYALTQTISGRRALPTFFEFRYDLMLKGLKLLEPAFNVTHNLKQSYSYRVSTPLKLIKKLNLNVNWQRKIIKDNFLSDTSDFSTSLGYNASLFSLASNYNYSRNLLEASVRKNFSINMKLKPLHFLDRSIRFDISSVYMFSELPYGDQTLTRISPGITVALRSIGAKLPLGFKLVPGFNFNHLWDNRDESFTDFNYTLALSKEIGNFSASVDYALASRYRAENFWVEGNNRQNLNLNFSFIDHHNQNYSLLLRLYHNNQLALENISFTGKVNLLKDLNFSSFLLYYNKENKFRTVEVFIEKIFKKKIKIQGGYSLALKRFFIKFLTQ